MGITAYNSAATTVPGVYVPPGWGRFWRPKLAAASAGGGRATVAINGDSSGRYYSSNLDTTSWTGLLRTALQTAHGDGGSGFKSVQDCSLILPGVATAYAGNFFTLTGTWTNPAAGDGPASQYIGSIVDGSTLQTSRRGTTVGVYYVIQSGGGTFTVSIDGGTAVSVATAGTAGCGNYQVTGLSAGSHTILITKTGTTTASIHGVYGENTSGVCVNDFSIYGKTSGQLASTPTYSNTGAWTGGYLYPADLVILNCTGNDTNAGSGGTVPLTYAKNVRTYLQQVRYAGTTEAASQQDILLVMTNLGKFDPNLLADEYAAQLRGIADHYGAALINLNAYFRNSWDHFNNLGGWGVNGGPTTVPAAGTTGTDGVHPSDTGHQLYANVIIPIVSATS